MESGGGEDMRLNARAANGSIGGCDRTVEDEEGSDPDDIIDITPNRAVARKEARLRLARAALRERRVSGSTLSTLNMFGGDLLSAG